MQAITKAMNSTLSAMRGIQGAELGPTFASAAADVRLAESAVDQMNQELQQTPSSTQRAGDGFTVMKGIAVQAISAIASSIKTELRTALNSAFDRIDTMEQFERTMTRMTGDSDAAARALESLRGYVVGTAYGLDVAAESTQGFFAATRDIDRSIRIFGQLTDVVTGIGDGTNQAIEDVSYAVQKILSTGKVSETEIRMLSQRLPGITAYMGEEIIEQYKNIEGAGLSFVEMLLTSATDGANGMAGVAGAAQEAGSSWGATFDNMHAATTRGMQGIVNSIDEALVRNNLPELREMISSLGAEMELILTDAAWLIGNLIDLIAQIPEPIRAAFGTGVLYNWIRAVGGLQNAWAIASDYLMTSWDALKISYLTGVNTLLGFLDNLKLGWLRISIAITNSTDDMAIGVLQIMQNMVNGAINIVNDFINVVNSAFDTGIELIAEVTFAADAAAANEAAKQARAEGLAARQAEIEASAAERQTNLERERRLAEGKHAYRQAEIGRRQRAAAGGATEGMNLDDYTINTPEGKALKTSATKPVKIDSEDIKMLLDISTRDYQVTYQTLTPQIAVNVDTIRESADVNQVIEVLADWTEEVANSSLWVPA